MARPDLDHVEQRRARAARPERGDPAADAGAASGQPVARGGDRGGGGDLALISYPDPAREPGAFAAMAAASFDRAYDPDGARRQLLAIIADGSRVERLHAIRAPTLLIHGADDPLVPKAGSEGLAKHIRGAKLEIVPGMAHDLPPSRLERIAALIVGHCAGQSTVP